MLGLDSTNIQTSYLVYRDAQYFLALMGTVDRCPLILKILTTTVYTLSY
jgi:hypothetical protein